MAIPAEALDLIKSFEGYLKQIGDGRVKPYLCPAGVPTIGWGTTFYPNGKRVTMSDPPIDKEYATQCIAFELRSNEASVDRLTPGIAWHPLMRGAIVSFIYNCGDGAYRASTLRKRILAKEWADVPAQLLKWNKGGGRILAGLTRRRRDEAAMFMRGVKLLKEGGPEPLPETPNTAPSIPQSTTRREGVLFRAFRWVFGR